jgi:hypothetical protein
MNSLCLHKTGLANVVSHVGAKSVPFCKSIDSNDFRAA